mmetsp:Transcript_8962/g.20324  ORF Transcript_8962/g.20324 Transcript_8962/m.20324 type:complete len:234 (-) Transcript_8962:861-1562(-)
MGSPFFWKSFNISGVTVCWPLYGSIQDMTLVRVSLTVATLASTALTTPVLISAGSPIWHRGLRSIMPLTASKDAFASPLQKPSSAPTASRMTPADLREFTSLWKYSSKLRPSWIPISRTGCKAWRSKRRYIFSAIASTAIFSCSIILSAFLAEERPCCTFSNDSSVSFTKVSRAASVSRASFSASFASATFMPASARTFMASAKAAPSPWMSSSRSPRSARASSKSYSASWTA